MHALTVAVAMCYMDETETPDTNCDIHTHRLPDIKSYAQQWMKRNTPMDTSKHHKNYNILIIEWSKSLAK